MGYESFRYFVSPWFYTLCAFFILLTGTIFCLTLVRYSSLPMYEPLMASVYQGFWLPSLFIIPILTTRSLVTDKISGELDSLRVLRISPIKIIFSKFVVISGVNSGLWLLVSYFPIFAQKICPSLVPYHFLTEPLARWGGWILVSLVGSAEVAFGLLVGANVQDEAVAVVMTMVGTFLFLMLGPVMKHFPMIDANFFEDLMGPLYEDWNLFFQIGDFCRGIFDTRVLVEYGSITVACLLLAAMTFRVKE